LCTSSSTVVHSVAKGETPKLPTVRWTELPTLQYLQNMLHHKKNNLQQTTNSYFGDDKSCWASTNSSESLLASYDIADEILDTISI